MGGEQARQADRAPPRAPELRIGGPPLGPLTLDKAVIIEHPEHFAGPHEYDVAIYGAGPAGITLALDLAGSGLKVGLFEAGGFSPPSVTGAHPYAGENRGRPYDLLASRLRYLGGTSNHWGGWCRPLDASDFEHRPFIGVSGWPISRSEMDPYYTRAITTCEVATGGLGLPAFEHDFGYAGYIHQSHDELEASNFLFSPPTRFGERYREDLQRAEHVHCFLHSSLVRLNKVSTATESVIDSADVASSTGERFRVFAKHHVLAMGAIENARMLLLSDLANSSGYVGRFFSDHTALIVGHAVIGKQNKYANLLLNEYDPPLRVLPHLAFSDDLRREHELMNFGIIFLPRENPDVLARKVSSQADFLSATPSVQARILVRLENIPNPDSRLSLTNHKDWHGVPRVALDWQPSSFEFEAIERIGEILAQRIGISGGRVRITYRDTPERRRASSYQSHHLGTTRMSADPKDGVVDRHCATHDHRNLFVAGSSVFPVFGFANPTLTIVALCHRLAEHLNKVEGR